MALRSQKEIQFSLTTGKTINVVVEDGLLAKDYFDMIEKEISKNGFLKLTDFKGECVLIKPEYVIHFFARPAQSNWSYNQEMP